MGQILVFSEKDNVGYELLGGALEIAKATGANVAAVVLGADLNNRALEYLNRGAAKVYLPNAGKGDLLLFDGGVYAEAIAQVAKNIDASVVLIGCTRNGKELAGRLAQKLGAGCINDVNKVEVTDGQLVCERNALGGATVMSQTVTSAVAVISVMPANLEPAAKVMPQGEVVEVDFQNLKPSRVTIVERQSKATDAVDITEAKTLVCIGMGLGGKEALPQIAELAKLLGGEVACTKPISTDKKWLSEARLIGLSGKQCKPQLALCIGLSGQVQFTVGIRDAKTIVAINNDPGASIFQMSDYGIVGDLNEVVPKLMQLL